MTSDPPDPERRNKAPAANEAILASLWEQFNAEFPTEEECIEEIHRRITKAGMNQCHHCGNADLEKNYGHRVLRCRICKKLSWLTAKTFFHRMKLARPWLVAIWLMEHGLSISSSRFHKLVGCAYATALNIFKKLTTVIQNQLGENAVAVHSSVFSPLIGKRSRETPARSSPLAEQEEIDKEMANHEADTEENPKPGELLGQEKEVYDLLSSEPIHFDVLCQHTAIAAGRMSSCLTILELLGLTTCIAGNRYVRRISAQMGQSSAATVQSSVSEDASSTTKTIAAILDFVSQKFHRISRKYLQNYLAAYWCLIDRTRWQSGALLQACLLFRPITDDEILEYVSPAMVKILPC